VQASFGMVACWEATTDQKVARNAVMREYSKLHAERQAGLEARREALAQQLFREEAALQAELIASRQTPEEKKQALMRRAQGLWEAREAERQATANALLERHFRCAAAHTTVPKGEEPTMFSSNRVLKHFPMQNLHVAAELVCV
jgi:hypothetical protein